jgi:hypothetical protein
MKHRPNVNSFFPESVKYVKYRKTADTGGTAMRKIGILGLVGVLALVLAGCGGGGDDLHTVVIQSLSDQTADGDIGFTASGQFIISQADDPATGNVLYGVDSGGTEFRAFLSFPLDGSTGGGEVPLNAVILSADIEIFVNDVSFASSVPTLIDLVSFPVTGLTSFDYDSNPLLTRSPFNIFSSYISNSVPVVIDVTSLMVEAQRQGMANLQLRFLLDLTATSGLVEIDDGARATAPLLTVEYR